MPIAWSTRPGARIACGPVLAAVVCTLAAAPLFGQAAEQEMGEVAGFGGGAFGAGNRALVGASSGFAFSRHSMALVEAAYIPLSREILWRRPDIQAPQESYLLNFGLSFHVRFPVRERWAPYGIFGGGLLYNSYRAIAGPEQKLVAMQDFKGEFHTGAGVRYYIGPKWGIRPEVKVIVSSRTFYAASIGVFYLLPPDWP